MQGDAVQFAAWSRINAPSTISIALSTLNTSRSTATRRPRSTPTGRATCWNGWAGPTSVSRPSTSPAPRAKGRLQLCAPPVCGWLGCASASTPRPTCASSASASVSCRPTTLTAASPKSHSLPSWTMCARPSRPRRASPGSRSSRPLPLTISRPAPSMLLSLRWDWAGGSTPPTC